MLPTLVVVMTRMILDKDVGEDGEDDDNNGEDHNNNKMATVKRKSMMRMLLLLPMMMMMIYDYHDHENLSMAQNMTDFGPTLAHKGRSSWLNSTSFPSRSGCCE